MYLKTGHSWLQSNFIGRCNLQTSVMSLPITAKEQDYPTAGGTVEDESC